jgi:hypothetical protein
MIATWDYGRRFGGDSSFVADGGGHAHRSIEAAATAIGQRAREDSNFKPSDP